MIKGSKDSGVLSRIVLKCIIEICPANSNGDTAVRVGLQAHHQRWSASFQQRRKQRQHHHAEDTSRGCCGCEDVHFIQSLFLIPNVSFFFFSLASFKAILGTSQGMKYRVHAPSPYKKPSEINWEIIQSVVSTKKRGLWDIPRRHSPPLYFIQYNAARLSRYLTCDGKMFRIFLGLVGFFFFLVHSSLTAFSASSSWPFFLLTSPKLVAQTR